MRIIHDTPLDDIAHDKLGREPIVDLIVESINKTVSADHDCMVYGIYGKWGEGKTTLMNFIKNRLVAQGKDDGINLVEFNPWLVNNDEALLREFFKTIMADADETARGLFKKYGSLAIFASKTIINAALPGFGTALADVIESAKEAMVDSEDTLSNLKDKTSEAIVKSGRHLVVMIDDVDRLDKEELHSVLRLIRQVADFRNCIYLLAMDDDMVSKSIGDYYGMGTVQDGHRFLDKIVQIPIKLPKIALANMQTIVREELLTTLHEYTTDAEIDDITKEIAPMMHTCRDLKRYCNQIAFVLPYMAKEVCIKDLCVLEAIKVVSTDVYERICIKRSQLMHEIEGFPFNPDLSGVEDETRSNYDDALNWIIEELPADTKDAVRKAIENLFTTKYLLYQMDLDEKRINTDIYFHKYFTLDVPSDLIPDQAIEKLSAKVDEGNIDDIVSQINIWTEKYDASEIKRAAIYLIRKKDKAEQQCKVASIMAKVLSTCKLSKDYPTYIYHDQDLISTFISVQLIRRYMFVQNEKEGHCEMVDEGMLDETMGYIFANGELNFCMGVLCTSQEIYGLGGYDGSTAIMKLVDRFKQLSYKEQFGYSKFLLVTILKSWKRADQESFNEYAKELLSDENVSIVRVLDKFLDEETGQDVIDFVNIFRMQTPIICERIKELDDRDKKKESVRIYSFNYEEALRQGTRR